jgi:uncharacterized membrane protein
MEPTSTVAGGFAISKIYYALSALFMSMVVLFLRKTPALAHHGKAATGAIVGGTAVGASVIFGGWLTVFFGLNPDDANTAMAIGGLIGLASFTIIKSIVAFFDKMDGKDIVEVAQEVKLAAKTIKDPLPKPAAKKVPAKRAPRKAAK